MKKNAVYKALFLFAIATLLLSGTSALMACTKSGSPGTDDSKKIIADPDSKSNTGCEKHTGKVVEVKPPAPEVPEVSRQVHAPAPKQDQAVKEDVTNSMSFNFMYYLFYKFSVNEFFKTPDFSESSQY